MCEKIVTPPFYFDLPPTQVPKFRYWLQGLEFAIIFAHFFGGVSFHRAVCLKKKNNFKFLVQVRFQRIGPLGQFFLLVVMSVCVSVRPYVCLLLRYRLKVFLPPVPKVGCQTFLEIRNPLGQVIQRSGLRFENLY